MSASCTACRLVPVISLASNRTRSPHAVTILVTATVSRLNTLLGLCDSWDGVLAVAVYVPIEAGSETASGPANLSTVNAADDAVTAVFDGCASS